VGMTIAQFLLHKARERLRGVPLELTYYNPLECKLGGIVTIDTAELDGLFFRVDAIRVYVEAVDRKTFQHVEYILEATPDAGHSAAGEDGRVRRRLWVYPAEDTDAFLKFRMVLLEAFWDGSTADAAANNLYNHEFTGNEDWREGMGYPALQDPGGIFRGPGPDGTEVEYRRRSGDLDPHNVRVTFLRDEDRDGTLQDDEIQDDESWWYWDFERRVTDERTGHVSTEYLTVVEDGDGWFTCLRGREVLSESVSKL
jgi:hypothetical protein